VVDGIVSYIKKGKLMYNQDELFAEIAREEREAMEAWDEKMKDYHEFSNWLDEDVTRCEKCGMNVLGQFSKCDDYIAYRDEANRKLREAAGF
jgi:hypothetical protein